MHRHLDRYARIVDAADDAAGEASDDAARGAAALPRLVELQDVAGDQVARADQLARGNRRGRRNLTGRREIVLLQDVSQMRAIEDVELSAVDQLVREQIRDGDAGFEVAPPVAGEALRVEVQNRDRRPRGCKRGRRHERYQRENSSESKETTHRTGTPSGVPDRPLGKPRNSTR